MAVLDLTAAQQLFFGSSEAQELWQGPTKLWEKSASGDATPVYSFPASGIRPFSDYMSYWEGSDDEGTVVNLQFSGGASANGGTVEETPTGEQAAHLGVRSDSGLYLSSAPKLPLGAADRTAIYVARYNQPPSTNGCGLNWGNLVFADGFDVSRSETGLLQVRTRDLANASYNLTTAASLDAGVWYVIAATSEAGVVHAYLDGTEVGGPFTPQAFSTSDDPLGLGEPPTLTQAFAEDAHYAAAFVYDVALSAAEIAQVSAALRQQYIGT